jgi:hypothetical protein
MESAHEILVRWRHEESVFKRIEIDSKLEKIRAIIQRVEG